MTTTPAGFYSPAQLAAIMARDAAYTHLVDLATAAVERGPSNIPKVYDLPGIYEPGVTWAKWWAIAGPLTMDTDGAHQLALAAALLDPHAAPTLVADYQLRAQQTMLAWTMCTSIGKGNDGPLSFVETVPGFIFADVLMGTAWPNRQRFLEWLSAVYIPTCDSIKTRPNNWGAWGCFGAILARRHVGQDTTADVQLLVTQLQAMIAKNGTLPQEMLRTGSQLWYSYFALVPLTMACRLVRNAGGVDLFRGPSQASIVAAIDNLLEMAAKPTEATGKPTGQPATPWPYDLVAAMAEEYNDAEWRAAAAPYAPVNYWSHHTGYNCPTLTALAGL